MNSCPKCSSIRITGPRYRQRFGHECLEYTCAQCSYTTTTPTHDDRMAESAAEIVRSMPTAQ
jgi:RNase P subunit RPR2